MIRDKLNDLIFGKPRNLILRNFNPKCFRNRELQMSFEKNGYVKLDNGTSDAIVNKLIQIHNDSEKWNTYECKENYFGSFSFKDPELRRYIREQTTITLEPVFNEYINSDLFSMPLGGGFCINPPDSKMGCYPHQDPTSVDEHESYSLSMWIALTDMDATKGCLHVLPGSHLWGNIYRSINIKWPFNHLESEIWQNLLPVSMKAGDILFFDLSTIHASSKNTTQYPRIGLNVPVLPKTLKKYCFYPSPVRFSYFRNQAEVYSIDENYFLFEDETQRPSEKYTHLDTINLDNYYSEKNVKDLLNEFNKNISKENNL